MQQPDCFDICPKAQSLFTLANQLGQDAHSRAALQAYSEIFCLEQTLKRGQCVKDWNSIMNRAGETATREWRLYSKATYEFYDAHNEIMNMHGRSVAKLVADMGTCVP